MTAAKKTALIEASYLFTGLVLIGLALVISF